MRQRFGAAIMGVGFRQIVSWGHWRVCTLMLGGLAVRAAYLYFHGLGYAFGEAANVAVTFARTGALSDPFLPGSGPTAHVTPLPPLLAGFVYSVVGVRSTFSEVILASWSISLTLASFYFCYRAFILLGLRQSFASLGLGFLCLVPLNINLETVWFRVWDGGMAVTLAFFAFWKIVEISREFNINNTSAFLIILPCAATLSVSPPLGLALYIILAIVFLGVIPFSRYAPVAIIVAVVTLLALSPWTVRNTAILGKPIVFRDNFGLELAQAFYPGAVDPKNQQQEFKARHEQIHPYANPKAVAQLELAGGERQYSDRLGRQAQLWIVANPASAARIAFRHLRDIIFPPAWYWTQFSEAGSGRVVKQFIIWMMTAMAFAELLRGLICRKPYYSYIAILLLVPILPYLMVQPTLRYRYIIYAPTAFLAALLLQQLLDQVFGWASVSRLGGNIRGKTIDV